MENERLHGSGDHRAAVVRGPEVGAAQVVVHCLRRLLLVAEEVGEERKWAAVVGSRKPHLVGAIQTRDQQIVRTLGIGAVGAVSDATGEPGACTVECGAHDVIDRRDIRLGGRAQPVSALPSDVTERIQRHDPGVAVKAASLETEDAAAAEAAVIEDAAENVAAVGQCSGGGGLLARRAAV